MVVSGVGMATMDDMEANISCDEDFSNEGVLM